MNPKYKVITKVVVTVLVIALSVYLFYLTEELYEGLMKQIGELGIK